MTRYDAEARLFAAALAAVAGWIDAAGFLMTGGFFVSFMSGNSTRLGIGLAGALPQAAMAGALVALFVAGAATGAVVGRIAGPRRPPIVLALVAVLVAAAAGLAQVAPISIAVLPVAFAMGAENTVFSEDGEVHIGLTFMTGALVRIGKRIGAALTGGPPLGWVPHTVLWLGFVAGAVAGAAAFRQLGANALWVAAAATLVLAILAARLRLAPAA